MNAEESRLEDETVIATIGGVCHHLSQPATALIVTAELLQSECNDCRKAEAGRLIEDNLQAARELQERLKELQNLACYRTQEYLQQNADDHHPIFNKILAIPKTDSE